MEKKIKSALISVFHKDNLEPVIRELDRLNVQLYSTGGTQEFIEGLGIKVTPVEDITDYPSILGGRVKTLHPKVFGGILGRRELESDVAQLESYKIPEIDLVIVDLYPFEKTVASGAPEQDIIEKIDIGGISLIRAAAKNFKDVVIIPDRDEYGILLEALKAGGSTTLDFRKRLAAKAFAVSSHYDSSIFSYFNDFAQLPFFRETSNNAIPLRYGENPHQKGTFYGQLSDMLEQIHGKELSYNNLLDIDAAVALMGEFETTTFAILKHNNACGVASAGNLRTAWENALAGDPVSAFGGVLITNAEVNAETAALINDLFFEVIIAPSYVASAIDILKQKKNRVILIQKPCKTSPVQFRTALNGVLVQDKDLKTEMPDDLKTITTTAPTAAELEDLIFANKLVKHTKSNTIVLVKDQQLLASGTGQTSRVDALRQAIEKARSFDFDLNGAVMASDAFFPFPDCVEIAHKAGITAVVQPGGSIKDQDSIDYCNNAGIAMSLTGTRHFKH